MDCKVLIVDDEVSVLSSLERSLRKESYQILSAQSGASALELLQENKVAVILSDVNMPGMDGIEFLSRAAEFSPDSVKMILSGYADIELVMDSINRGHVWRYLTKPWQPEDVKVAINNAIDLYMIQAERLNLLSQLEIKNTQLAKWSNKLEDMVNHRTEHIQSELMLMSCLMDGEDLNGFTRLVLPLFAEIFDSPKVNLISVADGVSYGLTGIEDADGDYVRHQIHYLQENRQILVEKDQIIIPVVNSDMVLGGLCVRDYGIPLEKISSDYESYMAITSIAMLHNTMKVKAPDMLDQIEVLLQEIG